MDAKDVASEGLRLISRLAGAAVSVPVVTGFVVLGAAVLVSRSLRDVASETWNRWPSLSGNQRDGERDTPKAA